MERYKKKIYKILAIFNFYFLLMLLYVLSAKNMDRDSSEQIDFVAVSWRMNTYSIDLVLFVKSRKDIWK